MTPFYSAEGISIYHGDCREVLPLLEAESVHALVTDPPAGIGMMGKSWDDFRRSRGTFVEFLSDVSRECLRVMLPGAHGLVWAIPRTSHWTATGLEDAGFEVRDRISHLNGGGFPKGLNVGKAIDRLLGNEREVVGVREFADGSSARKTAGVSHDIFGKFLGAPVITAPGSPEAKKWEGYSTALKPACEDWWLVRKPMAGTVAENVLRYGAGAINVDGCRIGDFVNDTPSGMDRINAANFKQGYRPSPYTKGRDGEASADKRYTDAGATNFAATPGPRGGDARGRWPANVTFDEEAARMLDEMVDPLTSGTIPQTQAGMTPRSIQSSVAMGDLRLKSEVSYGDAGGASRFFYCAKASRADRGVGNDHPTVKPSGLMNWLCRLITPPGGIILDPFCGSGSTALAAHREGFRFVGIEQDEHYCEIIAKRLSGLQLNLPLAPRCTEE